MALEEYARKRDFKKTPEPGPAPAKKHAGLPHFYVQRHDARRLHYDFRLEMLGTLKSWAVPKGPSLDPAVKALAVHVEDHPLDYGNFEGNIPAGNYGAGSVMLWDRGTYELLGEEGPEEQLKRGDVKFRLHGEKLKGTFALVHMKNRGKGDEWLLIKKKDEGAQPGWDIEAHSRSVLTGRTQEEIKQNLEPPEPARKRAASKKKADSPKLDASKIKGAVAAPMPASIDPMLSTLVERPPTGEQWVYEVKWDGVRAICYIENGDMRIFSRRGNPCERQYPELTVVPHFIAAESAILDAEIAVLDEKGRSKFALIQPRIMNSDPNSVSHMARKAPATLFVFDLLYCNGYDLRKATLADRKSALESILQPSERMQFSAHFDTDGNQMLEAARANGLEGIIAKDVSSRYEAGRSRCWLKMKVLGDQEFVICGFTHGDRSYFSSLVLGVWREDELVWAGNVGTGFDEKMLKQIWERIEPLITDKMPFRDKPDATRKITWVRPEVVCTVKFLEWTADGKLRAPVFVALRPDKDAAEVVREVPEEDPPPPKPAKKTVRKSASKPKKAAGAVRNEPLLPGKEKEVTLDIDGRTLKFTNLDKVFYPRDGYKKRDLLNYYNAVSDLLIPHLRDRPLSLKRYPNGIDKEFFFQKNVIEHFPDWLRTEPIHSEHRGEPINYVICDDRASLLLLTNWGCIDQNPWMSRVATLDCPDYVLIDLDPVECPYDLIVDGALLVRGILEKIGLAGYPKTTGGDGMHIYIPVEPIYTYEQIRQLAEIISILTIQGKPSLFTTPRSVSKRTKGKVYFDWMQIASSKTISAPYVLRAHDGAPVATPLDWAEVKPGLHPSQFTIANVLERFERTGDLFRPVLDNPQRIEPALAKLGAMMQKARG